MSNNVKKAGANTGRLLKLRQRFFLAEKKVLFRFFSARFGPLNLSTVSTRLSSSRVSSGGEIREGEFFKEGRQKL
jgi:hypothetical protein